MTHTIGLFSIHQRLDHVIELIAQDQEIEVHYRGKALFRLVPMEKPDEMMLAVKKKVAAMLVPT